MMLLAHRDERDLDGEPSLSGHCGHGSTCSLHRPVAHGSRAIIKVTLNSLEYGPANDRRCRAHGGIFISMTPGGRISPGQISFCLAGAAAHPDLSKVLRKGSRLAVSSGLILA
jgi:hypothetical protein